MTATVKLTADQASDLIFDALVGAGTVARNARYFADAILDTELSGLEGHGFYWLQYYCEHVQSGKVAIGLVGSRTDSRTRMAQELHSFFQRSGLPVVMYVPDSVVYPQCARDGMSIYDLPRNRTEQQIEAWQPLVDWLRAQLARVRASDAARGATAASAEIAKPGVVQVA